MELTPNEIRNLEFSGSMRGYDKAEVRAFINDVAAALEESRAKIAKLTDDFNRINAQYEQLKNLEDTIKSAVMEAQKNANQIIANAKKEAELILSKANQERGQMLEEQRAKLGDIESKIQKMEYAKETFYSKLRTEIEAHLKLVDSICPPEKKMDAEEVKSSEEDEAYEEENAGVSEEETAEEKPPMPEEPERPESPEMPVEPNRPSLEMKEEDIDSVVDQFGETIKEHTENAEHPVPPPVVENPAEKRPEGSSEEKTEEKESESKEKVENGQSKGYDF